MSRLMQHLEKAEWELDKAATILEKMSARRDATILDNMLVKLQNMIERRSE